MATAAANKTGAGKVAEGGDLGAVLLQSVLSTVLPSLLGAGNTTKKRASPEANAQATTAFNTLTKPQDYTGQTADILTRAAQEFAPTLAAPHAAGLYDTTMLTQLSNEAQARATAAAQSAILQDQTARASSAANLAGASMQANNDVTTGNTIDLGQTLLSGGAMLAAPFLLSKGKDLLGGIFNTTAANPGALIPGAMGAGQIQGMGSAAMKSLSQVFDPSTFNSDVADPLVGALTSGAGTAIGGIGDVGGTMASMFNGTGAIGEMGGLGSIGNLLSGDFGSAALTAIGSYFGGPFGGFIGDAIGGLFGCFLTTAVCDSTGLPDDNEYLSTLRQFRDGYMQTNYPWMIDEYYHIAPAITNYIKQRPDSDAVFKNMFHLFIVPAVARIRQGDNQGAMQVYKALVQYAKSQASLVAEV